MRNRLFWQGFTVPSAVALLSWLQRFFPSLPKRPGRTLIEVDRTAIDLN